MMTDKKEEKRGEIQGMSYGKIMTSLLIPKDSRTNPKRILSGIAFLFFVCFFVLASLSRGCHRDPVQPEPQQSSCRTVLSDTRLV